MRLLRQDAVADRTEMFRAAAACIAHRCDEHKDVPPMNMREGNGSSECGACAAEEFGSTLAEQALDIKDREQLLPVLEGYAARLAHHAVLVDTLERARQRMRLAGIDTKFISEALAGGGGGE